MLKILMNFTKMLLIFYNIALRYYAYIIKSSQYYEPNVGRYQEFNNKYVLLKLRYLGKLDKIISQLKKQNIMLQLIGDQWNLIIKQ